MLNRTTIVMTLAALALWTSPGSAAAPRVGINGHAPETICEAVKLPNIENGVEVTLDADFTSDRRHLSRLWDWGCPSISIFPYDGPDLVKDEGYEKFQRILYDGPPKIPLKVHLRAHGILQVDHYHNGYRFDVARFIDVVEEK